MSPYIYLLKVARIGRVTFAPGPLPTADGHPRHEGRQTARKVREVANNWGRSLTPEHVRALQQELGLENAASVDRLKRRSGPPLRLHTLPTICKWVGVGVTGISLQRACPLRYVRPVSSSGPAIVSCPCTQYVTCPPITEQGLQWSRTSCLDSDCEASSMWCVELCA